MAGDNATFHAEPTGMLRAPSFLARPPRPAPTSTRGKPSERARARDAFLAELALAAIASGDREVVLDDAALARLRGSGAPPAAALELCAHLTAPSQPALEQGDFTLVLSPSTGSPSPGALFGRVACLLDDVEAVGGLARRSAADPARPGALQAQLDFLPRGDATPTWPACGRSGPSASRWAASRTALHPPCAGWTISRRPPTSTGCMSWTPLDGQGDQPPVPGHAQPQLAPAALRLLREVPSMGSGPPCVWLWGGLSTLPLSAARPVRQGRSSPPPGGG